jgi:hypothetical protein
MKPQQAEQWYRLPVDHSFKGLKLVRASSPGDLIAHYNTVAQWTSQVIVQEEIPGPDTEKFVYLSCYSTVGLRLAYAVMRELRAGPPVQFGSATVVEPAVDTDSESQCHSFLQSIDYHGLCEIEVKRDPRDGIVKMIDTNARYSGTADAGPYDGVDLAWLHYLDLVGYAVTPVKPEVRDFRHIVLQSDVAIIPKYLEQGLGTIKSIARSYRPPLHFYDLDVRDWRNTLTTVGRVLRILAGSVWRYFKGKQESGTPGAG